MLAPKTAIAGIAAGLYLTVSAAGCGNSVAHSGNAMPPTPSPPSPTAAAAESCVPRDLERAVTEVDILIRAASGRELGRSVVVKTTAGNNLILPMLYAGNFGTDEAVAQITALHPRDFVRLSVCTEGPYSGFPSEPPIKLN